MDAEKTTLVFVVSCVLGMIVLMVWEYFANPYSSILREFFGRFRAKRKTFIVIRRDFKTKKVLILGVHLTMVDAKRRLEARKEGPEDPIRIVEGEV